MLHSGCIASPLSPRVVIRFRAVGYRCEMGVLEATEPKSAACLGAPMRWRRPFLHIIPQTAVVLLACYPASAPVRRGRPLGNRVSSLVLDDFSKAMAVSIVSDKLSFPAPQRLLIIGSFSAHSSLQLCNTGFYLLRTISHG